MGQTPSSSRTDPTWPRLPRRWELQGGWVRITRPKQVHDGKRHADWDRDTRVIRIERHLTNREAWRYLFHELTHARLDDTRMFISVEPLELSTDQEEAICEAMALALHFQMRRQLETGV